jgi:hypothetical protein
MEFRSWSEYFPAKSILGRAQFLDKPGAKDQPQSCDEGVGCTRPRCALLNFRNIGKNSCPPIAHFSAHSVLFRKGSEVLHRAECGSRRRSIQSLASLFVE